MKRFFKKGLCFSLAVVFLSAAFGLGACSPRKVEGNIWTYYIQEDGTAALIGLNPNAVPEDGVLYIPNTVDGRKVAGFGYYLGKGLMSGWVDHFQIPFMQKIIVAEGVPINNGFWFQARLIELESKDPDKDIISFAARQVRLIVPDGMRDRYLAALEAQLTGASEHYVIVEKSNSIGLEWLVDEDGLLKGYFGLEPDHYVLPDGIKKIDSRSWGGGDNPKTIILNEDLEEIGKDGLHFYSPRDVIMIPKSVNYIDEDGVIAHIVSLYRSTQHHEKAFWHLCEVTYLD